MSQASIDRIAIHIKIESFASLDAAIVRHLAPRTCDSILRSLPSESKGYLWKDSLLYFELPVGMGPEKARRVFKQGELLYWPLRDAVCIALADGTAFSQVNQIGSVSGTGPRPEEVRPGVRIRIARVG